MKTRSITIRRETTWLNPETPVMLLFGLTEPRGVGVSAPRTWRPTTRWNRTELLGGVPAHVRR